MERWGISPLADQGIAGGDDDDRGLDRHARRARLAVPAARRARASCARSCSSRGSTRGPPDAPSATAAVRSWPAPLDHEPPACIRAGVHHVDLVVSSIARSLPFYRDLLGPLGWHRISEVEGERGETIWYLSGPGDVDRPARGAEPDARSSTATGRPPPPRVRGAVARRRRRARRLAEQRRAPRSRAARRSTRTCRATTRCSSTTRTGSSWRSSMSQAMRPDEGERGVYAEQPSDASSSRPRQQRWRRLRVPARRRRAHADSRQRRVRRVLPHLGGPRDHLGGERRRERRDCSRR